MVIVHDEVCAFGFIQAIINCVLIRERCTASQVTDISSQEVVAFSAFIDLRSPSGIHWMRLESESRKGLEMDLKRLKFEFNPESVDPGLHNNSLR